MKSSAVLSALALAAAAAILVVAFDLASRPLAGRAPGAVQPTVDAIRALGLRCDDGVPDNVPSGLSQWHCRGSLDGTEEVAVLIDGNDAGVTSIDVVTPTDDVVTARAIVERVATATPPLVRIGGLVAHLRQSLGPWDGRQTSLPLGQLQISALCQPPSQLGDGECIILFGGLDPLQPIVP